MASKALATAGLVAAALGVSGPAQADASTVLPPGADNRWADFGPSPIAAGDPNRYQQIGPTSGRVNAVEVSPTDPDVVFIGTSLGGVWRTTDAGQHWTPIFDDASSLAVGDLRLDGTTLWVGTGAEFGGDGLYRIPNAVTVDEHAVVLEGPFDVRVAGTGTGAGNEQAFAGNTITAIAIDPNNHDRMFVATNDRHFSFAQLLYGSSRAEPGLYYTANAQATRPDFSKVSGVGPQVDDALFLPGSSDELIVAALDVRAHTGAVLRTDDATAAASGNAPSFTPRRSFTGSGSGLQADLGASGDTVYAATSQDIGTLYKSTDRGQTFARGVSGTPGPDEFKSNATGWGVGDHTGAVAVDPTNADNVMLGGAYSCFRHCEWSFPGGRFRVLIASTDGGETFRVADGPYEQREGRWLAYLHPDTVAIAYAPSNPDIAYTGNDGGPYRTDNARDSGSTGDDHLSPVKWESLSTPGLAITQFYSLAIHPTDPNYTIGGTQDNGAVLFAPDLGHNWKFIGGGDVYNVAIDQNATDTSAVTSYVDCYRYTSTANVLRGAPRVSLAVTPRHSDCRFPGRYQLGPGNPNSLYVGIGQRSVFRSGDSGTMWQPVTPFVRFDTWTALAVSPQDDKRRIFARGDGRLFYTTTGSTTLTDATGAWPKGAGVTITAAVFDPQHPDTAYIGLGGPLEGSQGYLSRYSGSETKSHVWKTTNLTAATPTWTAVGAVGDGLPDLPVRSLLVDPADPQNVFLGTDSGVFASGDGGEHWAPFGDGLPRGCTPRPNQATCAPTIMVRNPTSMAIVHPGQPDARLRIATHSRGMWQIRLGDPYAFAGFFQPIDNQGVNVAKAGRAIPVKWRLSTADGTPITDPRSVGSLTSNTCTPAQPVDDVETHAGKSGLRYLGDGVWQFNWRTPDTYAGQCRTLKLNLADDSTHTAKFNFK